MIGDRFARTGKSRATPEHQAIPVTKRPAPNPGASSGAGFQKSGSSLKDHFPFHQFGPPPPHHPSRYVGWDPIHIYIVFRT